MGQATKLYYDNNYARAPAQRHYPNEELVRFCGREFFSLPPESRKNIHILELGCGNGANLWMLAREGFQVHGIDLSNEAVSMAREKLASWGATGDIRPGDMTALSYQDASMQAVLDVFACFCLDEVTFRSCLKEIHRVLTPGGKFFSYQPSKDSDAFTNHAPARKLDGSTLENIQRTDSAYHGLAHPSRFISPEEYQAVLEQEGFKVTHMERVSRTYDRMREYFEFLSVVAEKQ